MSNEINITIPAISADLIETLQTEKLALTESETQAIAAIRQKYAPLAKHNGFICIGHEAQDKSNSSWRREAYYRDADGKKIHGLLCVDEFGRENYRGDVYRGRLTGSRLYLIETGEWLQLTRSGRWSRHQGSLDGWACGDVDWDDEENAYDAEERSYSGSVEVLSDAEVADAYALPRVIETLSLSLRTMAEKLPKRLTRIRQRADLASKLLAALRVAQ